MPKRCRRTGRRQADRVHMTLIGFVFVLMASLFGPVPPAVAQEQAPAVPETIRITGGGWGHGVGMSQFGAYGRAAAGHSHEEILGFYYPGTEVVTREIGNGGLRIHLSTARTTTVESAGTVSIEVAGNDDLWVSGGATTLTIDRPSSARMRIRTPDGTNVCRQDGAYLCGTGAVTLRFKQGEPVKTTATGLVDAYGTSGNRYRWGRLVFTPTAGSIDAVWTVLQGLDMQEYLYGLAEMPASWPEAALESQAIAGRTYAFANILKRRADPNRTIPWDLYSSVWDQYYSGYGHEIGIQSDRWIDAVDTTTDNVMTFEGSPFTAFYGSSNGGYTEDSGYVFVTSLPYLIAKPDPFDSHLNPYSTWTREYAGDDLGRWIQGAGRGSIGEVTAVSVGGNVGLSGRVDRATVTVTGTEGTATMTGPAFMAAVNAGVTAAGGGRESQLIGTLWRVGGRAPNAGNELVPASGGIDELRRRDARVVVTGWVLDPSGAAAGPAAIRMTIGRRTAVVGAAVLDRFDVAEANGEGEATGFRIVRPIARKKRTVCLYVTSAVGGDEVSLGCRRV